MKISLPASTATLTHEICGDVGGNAQYTVIEVTSDSGQFPSTVVTKTETGFRLEIVGTWEAGEMLAALALCAKEHGDWDVHPEQRITGEQRCY